MSTSPGNSFHLNDDCVFYIVQYLEGDFVTLANLLRVSKQWFRAVVPVLYARPFTTSRSGQTSQSLIPETEMISKFSKERLWFLLGLCSGFLEDAYGWDPKQEEGIHLPPSWLEQEGEQEIQETGGSLDFHSTTAVKAPTTINYFEFVKELPLECELHFGWPRNQWLWEKHWVLHLKFHGTWFTSFHARIVVLCSHIWDYQVLNLLPNLNNITLDVRVWRNLHQAPRLEKMIQQHVDMFPNKLQSVQLTNMDGHVHWDLFMRLLLKIRRPENYVFSLARPREAHPRFRLHLDLHKESVKELHISMDVECVDGIAELLSQCRQVEKLTLKNGPPGVFEWARLEQEQFDEWYQDQHTHGNSDRQSQSIISQAFKGDLLQWNSEYPSTSQPLIPVKFLSLSGNSCIAFDAISGFRYSLQEIHLAIPLSDTSPVAPWSFEFPNLEILRVLGPHVKIDLVTQACPHLKELVLNSTHASTLANLGCTGLPRKLRILSLVGRNYFMELRQNIVELIKSLHATLEVLDLGVLELDDPNTTQDWVAFIGDELVKDFQSSEIEFSQLLRLKLSGASWVKTFMGSLLRVSPRLHTAMFFDMVRTSFEHETMLPFLSNDTFTPTNITTATASLPLCGQTTGRRPRIPDFKGLYPNLKHLQFENVTLKAKFLTLPQPMRISDFVLTSRTLFPNLEDLVLTNISGKRGPNELRSIVATVMKDRESSIKSLRTLTVGMSHCNMWLSGCILEVCRPLSNGELAKLQGRNRWPSGTTKEGCIVVNNGKYFVAKET